VCWLGLIVANPVPLSYQTAVSPLVVGRWRFPGPQQIRADAVSAGSLTASLYSQAARAVFTSSANRDGTVKVSKITASAVEHVTLKDWGSVDVHNNAGLITLNDGRIMAVYCYHQSANTYKRVSATPYQLDFGAESQIFWTGNSASYPSLYRTSNGTLWIFYCVNANGRDIYYRTSTDEGVTWSAPTVLWQSVNGRIPYWGVGVHGNDVLIAIAGNNAYADSAGTSSGYFARFDGSTGQWKRANGSAYSLPILESAAEIYFNASTYTRNAGFNPSPTVTQDGRPVIFIEGTDPNSTYYRCEYSGSTWTVSALPSESSGSYNPSSPVPAFGDSNTCYLIRPVSGRGQVFRYTFNGSEWSAEQLTNFTTGNATQQIMRIDGNGPRWIVHQLNRTNNSDWQSVMHLGRN